MAQRRAAAKVAAKAMLEAAATRDWTCAAELVVACADDSAGHHMEPGHMPLIPRLKPTPRDCKPLHPFVSTLMVMQESHAHKGLRADVREALVAHLKDQLSKGDLPAGDISCQSLRLLRGSELLYAPCDRTWTRPKAVSFRNLSISAQ